MIGVFSPEREYKMKGFGGTLSALDKTEGHFCSIFILSLFLMIFMKSMEFYQTPFEPPGMVFFPETNVTASAMWHGFK